MTTGKPSAKPLLPDIFYDEKGSGYWLKLDNGRFLNVDKSDLKVHLRFAGIKKDEWLSNGLTQLEFQLMQTQKEKAVQYAGPLAGYRIGQFLTCDGSKILVTSEPRPEVFAPPAKRREWPALEEFLGSLLGGTQLPYVLLWLKYAREALRKFDFRPGQLLVLAGPSNCGKSLLQALITEFLGGRAARPYRYMIGETAFNADLAAAEHLVIEDENASTDIRSRRKFGASIKEFTVCADMSVHAKGRQAIALKTYKRMSLSVNDEPENISILPPMDESIQDKVMLMKCAPAILPSKDRLETWKRLTAELPALDADLAIYRCPKGMADSRFGVVAYHNPDLLELVLAIAPETRLLNLIDQVIDFKAGPWSGSAEDLEQELRQSEFALVVEKMFYYTSACAVYLGRLAQKYPQRFENRKDNGKSRWTIRL